MSPRILILDTYYTEALAHFVAQHPEWGRLSRDAHLQVVLDSLFGTADFYSRNLRLLGWDALDMIANYHGLQGDGDLVSEALGQIDQYHPDVLFLQDLNFLPAEDVAQLRQRGVLIAAQLSCPLPALKFLVGPQVIFTSFPHYVEKLPMLGAGRTVYSPLACEPSAIDRTLAGQPAPARDIDVLFVGGVGANVHWCAGTEALEDLASEFGPRFQWYGYGTQHLEPDSPLLAAYRGEAWGRDMYHLLLRAKVAVNRHGEVAQGYANNMRLFEATGAGALLVTEATTNLGDFFGADEVLAYGPGELPTKVRWALDNPDEAAAIAARGMRRTLTGHTYYRKMQQVDAVLREELSQ
jgi:spore maturation protein CgeB